MNHPDASVSDQEIREALKAVIDPEVGVNIVDLGLLESIEWPVAQHLKIGLIMTSPTCPLGDFLVGDVKKVLAKDFPKLLRVDVEILEDPMWNPERMSPEALSAPSGSQKPGQS